VDQPRLKVFLARSSDGNFIVLSGYDAAAYHRRSRNVPHLQLSIGVIGRVDAAGNVDTTTALTDAISGGNPARRGNHQRHRPVDKRYFFPEAASDMLHSAPQLQQRWVLPQRPTFAPVDVVAGQLYVSSGNRDTKGRDGWYGHSDVG